MNSISKHYTLVTSPDVAEICKPIYALGVNFFAFSRFYADSTFLGLNSRPEWVEYYLSSELHHTSTLEQHPNCYRNGNILWSYTEEDQTRQDLRQYFNTSNGFTLVEKYENACDMYHFATTNDNEQFHNYLLNNLDLLQKFALYFKDEADRLIKNGEKFEENKFSVSATTKVQQNEIAKTLNYQDSFNANAALNRLTLHKFYLVGKFHGRWLTRQECRCIAWLIRGKTLKEIGLILQISAKTVIEHIEHVKDKLNCYKQTSLVYTLVKQGFEPDFFI